MKRLTPPAALAALLLFLAAPPALGCVCEPESGVAEAVGEAAAVFAGKFVGAEYRKGIVNGLREMMEQTEGGRTEYEVLVLKFEVERWWKGGAAREVLLVTEQTKGADGTTTVSDCEIEFAEGERYLIYAHAGEAGLATGRCTRTKRLKKAGKDLKALGKGGAPAGVG